MKKFNQDKKRSKESFVNLFNTKGFYIILILSVVIIGGATILITRQSLNSISENENFLPDDFEDYLVDYENNLVENDLINNNLTENDLVENEGAEGETAIDEADDSASVVNNQLVGIQAGGDGEKETVKDDNLQISDNTAAKGEGQLTSEKQWQPDNVAASNESQAVKIPDNKDKEEEKPKQEQDDREENSAKDTGTTEKKPSNEGKESLNDKAAEEKNDEAEQAAEGNQEVQEVDFIMPVYGSIIYDYFMDKLAYSVTLNDWRTHKGIDIAAARGTAVKAVADGVVTEVCEDPKLGFTVVIEHANGLKTVYSNLASGDMVVPNQIVAQGESIGSVGDTALYEIALEPHLHFEVLKDDQIVDPKLYLPSY
ncbi:MAG: peptidoglycan DD-metalloendopeptidase family protein [Clostridiaceae bacterium]|nr:peptidoglycan DD-metalloendopeptidase family protein [Clostridiaceae bacterium]